MPEPSQSALIDSMKKILEQNPFLAKLDRDQAEVITQNMLAPFAAIAVPGPSSFWAWQDQWLNWQKEMTKLWLSTAVGKVPSGETADRRFKSAPWDKGIFPFLRESYILAARTMAEMADSADLPPHEQRKLSFYARLAADALAPSNYVLTNPEVLERAKETNGQSLVDGFRNLMKDLQKGYISTNDETAFKVGKNLATSPGAVVFRNELIEVIQYQPITEKVRKRPVLIIPPCVNKFYIFDLNERKSMIRYLVGQGVPVFTISWRNPYGAVQDFGWDDYLKDGIYAALETASDIAEADKVDLLSWCNGGTMLTAALAVIPAELKGKVGTATFLSALIDFSDPGDLQVFIDRPQLMSYGKRMRDTGVAPGRDIARAMALLHANESVWNFVIGNYLMGKPAAPFDILYWNADTANLPQRWYSVFVEDMYIKNLLKEPGALTLQGRPVDIRNIDVPCYFLAASEDHIVPWKGSYHATRLLGGKTTFVLTDGGHVSGTVINHPAGSRRHFHVGGNMNSDPEDWLASATRHEGSWWTHWLDWLESHSAKALKPAPVSLGSRNYPPLESAPGTYVIEQVRQDG